MQRSVCVFVYLLIISSICYRRSVALIIYIKNYLKKYDYQEAQDRQSSISYPRQQGYRNIVLNDYFQRQRIVIVLGKDNDSPPLSLFQRKTVAPIQSHDQTYNPKEPPSSHDSITVVFNSRSNISIATLAINLIAIGIK